jgi:PIN domain nuclease of toxin-antitoxin system
LILLDTHTWIWWVDDPTRLSESANVAIDEAIATRGVYISSISVWEVAILVQKGRLQLTMDVDDWVAHTEMLPFVTFVPISNRIAIKSVRLLIHPDPADRMIIATALGLGVPIVTKDRKISAYIQVQTVW